MRLRALVAALLPVLLSVLISVAVLVPAAVAGTTGAAYAAGRTLPAHDRLVMTTPSRARAGSYHTYRAGRHPVVHMRAVSRRPVHCVSAIAQQYQRHAWHTFARATCLRLDAGGHTAARLLGSYRAGTRVRIVGYVRGSSVRGHAAHAALYLLFTR